MTLLNTGWDPVYWWVILSFILVPYLFYRIFKSGTTFKAPGQSWQSARENSRSIQDANLRELSEQDEELIKEATENLKKGFYPINSISLMQEVRRLKNIKEKGTYKERVLKQISKGKNAIVDMLNKEDKLAKLNQLFELKQKGAITEEEYEKEKRKLL